MIGVPVQMQCRATNPLARRIERWSPNTCVCRPPRKTRSTEETANYCSGTRQPSHIEGAHDDAQLLGSCKCHCCTGIGFFELSKDFLLREFFHMPALTTTEKFDLCLCQENEVGGHACTGCNALGLNRTV